FREGGQGGVETKRGCPARCIYCADPLAKGRTLRLRSPEKVAEEFRSLLSQGVTHLHLCDSEFNLPLEHALGVSRELIAQGLGEEMRWWAYLAPKPFPRELARLMKRAGCAGINFGADSGSDRMLKRLGRDFGREDLRETARICREEGITLMFDLLLGGPGEDRESPGETISLMKEIGPDRVGASLGVRVYPGTELARQVRREGLGGENPNLKGAIEGNGSFLKPIFYLSRKMGDDPEGYLRELIAGDERFFLGSRPGEEGSYNYNANEVLLEAIRSGERGAYWDILRRVRPP
ncbi:MAG: B12-binding domain-containing radical SAM protein, partial [Nitrospinota bacterium]